MCLLGKLKPGHAVGLLRCALRHVANTLLSVNSLLLPVCPMQCVLASLPTPWSTAASHQPVPTAALVMCVRANVTLATEAPSLPP